MKFLNRKYRYDWMQISIYLHLLVKPKLLYRLKKIVIKISTYAGSAKPFVYTTIFLTSVLHKMYSILAMRSFLLLFVKLVTLRCNIYIHLEAIKMSWKAPLIRPLLMAAQSPFLLMRIRSELLRTSHSLCFEVSFW